MQDIGAAELHLTQIASETADAQVQASESVDEVGTLRDRLKELQRRLIKNERDVKDAAREAETAAAQAQRAAQNADELETAYERALRALDDKAARGGDARERALKLQEKANRLASGVADKLRELKGGSRGSGGLWDGVVVGRFRIKSDTFAAVIAFNEVITWSNFVFSSVTPRSLNWLSA